MVRTKNLNFFIVMLRAPSMCGHKGTKIFLKTFSLFTDCCLPRFFCLSSLGLVRQYRQILRVQGTPAEER